MHQSKRDSALSNLRKFEHLHSEHNSVVEREVISVFADLAKLRDFVPKELTAKFDNSPLEQLPNFIAKTLKVNTEFYEQFRSNINKLEVVHGRNTTSISYKSLKSTFISMDMENRKRIVDFLVGEKEPQINKAPGMRMDNDNDFLNR